MQLKVTLKTAKLQISAINTHGMCISVLLYMCMTCVDIQLCVCVCVCVCMCVSACMQYKSHMCYVTLVLTNHVRNVALL